MPARLVVALKPEAAGALPPPQTGPAVGAALLRAIRDGGFPQVATAFHDARPPKPYAVTPLLDGSHRPPGRESAGVRFEVGVLRDDAFAPVLAALQTRKEWTFGRTRYRTDEVFVGEVESYPELLGGAEPATSWPLRLLTPATFVTSHGEGVRLRHPLPDAERVFGELAWKWSAYAGGTAPLPDATTEAIEEQLEPAEFDLRSAEHMVNPKAPPMIGSVGTVRYAVAQPHNVPAHTRRALSALARFALYAGLGHRTTVGMGFCLPG